MTLRCQILGESVTDGSRVLSHGPGVCLMMDRGSFTDLIGFTAY